MITEQIIEERVISIRAGKPMTGNFGNRLMTNYKRKLLNNENALTLLKRNWIIWEPIFEWRQNSRHKHSPP